MSFDQAFGNRQTQSTATALPGQMGADLIELLKKRSDEAASDPFSRNRLLSILDLLWMNQLDDLEALSESVGLRAYGQKDPIVEYRHEAHRLFQDFWNNFNGWVFSNIFRLAQNVAQTNAEHTQTNAEKFPRNSALSLRNSAPTSKVGRNDPCPCGAKNENGHPKKYKHCHGR